MNALKAIRKRIEADPTSQSSQTFVALVVALAEERAFDLSKLYELDYEMFQLALSLMNEWRLDRYHAATLKLMGTAWYIASVEKS